MLAELRPFGKAPVVKDSFATYSPGVSERRSGVSTFQHSGIKNADAQSNVSQVVTATRVYDAFGNLTSSSGTWSGPFGYGGPFGYQEDSETGYNLLGHRYYDPTTGRFLTRDQAKDGRNWYAYCDNNPLTFSDPWGLDKLRLVKGPGGAGLGGHLTIGVDDGTGRWAYYGFYPGKEGDEGGSSGKGGRENGDGYVKIRDYPRIGSVTVEIEIDPWQRRYIVGRILKSRLTRMQGLSEKPYDIVRYNCATWVVAILANPDDEDERFSGLPSYRAYKWSPKKVQDLFR